MTAEYPEYPRKWDKYRDKVHADMYDEHHNYMRNPTHENFLKLTAAWNKYLELHPEERFSDE